MRNYLKLLLVASIALPISAAKAQDSNTETGSLPTLNLPPLNLQQEQKIELNVLEAYDEQDNLVYSEIIGSDDPIMNAELPEGVYIDSLRLTESQLREEYSQDGYNLNDLDGDGQIEEFELESWNRGSISDASNGDRVQSDVITPGEHGTLPFKPPRQLRGDQQEGLNEVSATFESGVPVTAESTQGYVEHTYETSNYGVLSTSHNNPEGFSNLENYLSDIGANYTAMDLVDQPLPNYLDPRSVFGEIPGTVESLSDTIEIPGVDPRSARSVAGTEILGDPFEILSDGTQLFETAAAPVAVRPDGVVQALDLNNRVRPDVILGEITSSGTIDTSNMVNNIAGDIVGNIGSNNLAMLGLGLDAINGDGTFMGFDTGTLGQGNFNAGALAGGLVNYAAGSAINNVLNRFTGLGALGGGNYTIGNNGLGNGFSLAIGPDRVQANRANFLSNIGGGGGGFGGLLGDAINGDGTFMGQQTGNLFQGNLNLSNFNAGSALGFNTGGTTATGSTSGGSTSGTTSTSYPNYAPPTNSSTSGSEYTIPNTGPR